MILLIDTAQETGTVALAEDGLILYKEENKIAKETASWLHAATGSILSEAGLTVRDLKAIAVVNGPGSYTGLRVALAAAKGFCYALKIPLITENTLKVMAAAAVDLAREKNADICPMIDARRNEVFTAVYDTSLREVVKPQALILEKTSFEDVLSEKNIFFFGTGAMKWQNISTSGQAVFIIQPHHIQSFAVLADEKFKSQNWSDAIYTEPVYLKEFFSY